MPCLLVFHLDTQSLYGFEHSTGYEPKTIYPLHLVALIMSSIPAKLTTLLSRQQSKKIELRNTQSASEKEIRKQTRKVRSSSETDTTPHAIDRLDTFSAPSAHLPIAVSMSSDEFLRLKESAQRWRRDFIKIANTRFEFKDNATAYAEWIGLFRITMASYDGLDWALDHAPKDSSTEWDRTRQSEVFNMILHCIPRGLVTRLTTVLPPNERTAYHAWRALRQHYRGDEQTYLLNLENKYNNLQWKDDESFHDLETRFESILTELGSADQVKPDHSKKLILLRAFEGSSRKDAQGQLVFTRLGVVAKINRERPYKEWMDAIRLEMQDIDYSLDQLSTKRQRTGPSEREAPYAPVSYVTTVSPPSVSSHIHEQHPANANRPRIAASDVCFNYSQRGSCRFGTSCRYSHSGQSRSESTIGSTSSRTTTSYSTPRSEAGNPSRRPPQVIEACRNFKRGNCRMGQRCRWLHSSGQSINNSGVESGAMARIGAITLPHSSTQHYGNQQENANSFYSTISLDPPATSSSSSAQMKLFHGPNKPFH